MHTEERNASRCWKRVNEINMDTRVKIKESKMIDKYLDLARELEKIWNMMVTMILDVFNDL